MMCPRSTNTFESRPHAQRGAAAIELALLLPVLLLMADGVVEMGLMLHNQSVLISATHMAARAGVAAGPSKPTTEGLVSMVNAYCQSRLISPGAHQDPVVEVVQSVDATYPNPLRVTVRYQVSGVFVGGPWSAFSTGSALSASTVMFNE